MAKILTPDEITEFFDKQLSYEQKGMSEDIGFDKIPRSLTDVLLSTKLSSEATRFLLFLCRKTHTVNTYQGIFTRSNFANDTRIDSQEAFYNLRNELDNGIFTTKAKQFDCQAQEFPFFHLEDLGKKSVEKGAPPVKHWQVTYLRSPFAPAPNVLTGWYVGTGGEGLRLVTIPNPDDIVIDCRIRDVIGMQDKEQKGKVSSRGGGVAPLVAYRRGYLQAGNDIVHPGHLGVSADHNIKHHVYHFQSICRDRQELIKLCEEEACRRCKREICTLQNRNVQNPKNTDIKGK